MSGIRTRWAAIGAAIAVTLGGGGLFVANAGSGPDYSSDSVFHGVSPTRVLDTRLTSAVSNGVLKLDVEGVIPTINSSGGTSSVQVVPTTASAIALNLTVTEGQKRSGYGFVKVYPCIATSDPEPEASAINFENRIDIANALIVQTSNTGEICLSVFGTADLIVDISGYYDDSRLDNIEDNYFNTTQNSYTMIFPAMNFVKSGFTGSISLTGLQPWAKLDTGTGNFGIAINGLSDLGTFPFQYALTSISVCWPNVGALNQNGAYIKDLWVWDNDHISVAGFHEATTSADFSENLEGCATYDLAGYETYSSTYYVEINLGDSNAGTAPSMVFKDVRATFSVGVAL